MLSKIDFCVRNCATVVTFVVHSSILQSKTACLAKSKKKHHPRLAGWRRLAGGGARLAAWRRLAAGWLAADWLAGGWLVGGRSLVDATKRLAGRGCVAGRVAVQGEVWLQQLAAVSAAAAQGGRFISNRI